MKHLEEKIINFDVFKQNNPDKFYIYLHITEDEDIPFYIGKGKKDRCKNHLDRSQWWKNIVNAHGYYIKILDINLDEKEAFNKEIEYINFFGRRQFGNGGTLVNLTDGGEGVSGRIYTDEERIALSKKFKENPEYWTSGRRKLYFGKQLFGEANPNFGNKGEKNPLSKKVVKLTLDGELVEIYNSASEAEKANNTAGVSQVCLGKRNQLKGFKYVYLEDYKSGNYTIQLGKTNKKPVYQLDLKTKKIIKRYESANETKKDGFNGTNVGQVCLGKKKSHLGYSWCFVSDYNKINKI